MRFPFSDLSADKLRPALIIRAPTPGQKPDYLFAQITSATKWLSDGISFSIRLDDLQRGYLPKKSILRPHILFTGHESLITSYIGIVTDAFRQAVVDSLKNLLDN